MATHKSDSKKAKEYKKEEPEDKDDDEKEEEEDKDDDNEEEEEKLTTSEVIKLAIGQSAGPSSDVLPKPEAHQTMLLIICNTGRPNKGEGQPEKRKEAISGLLNTKSPDIVFFQEFPWVGIERLKKRDDFPSHYEYIGHNHASILYDRNTVNVETMNYKKILSLLEEMKRINKIPEEFNPIGRMSMLKIESITCGKAHFICVSWHGPHKKSEKSRVEELKNLLGFIAAVGTKNFIIAGDFNIHFNIAKNEIDKHDGIKIHEFKPLSRRASNPVDYFITSSNLTLSNIAAIDWETLENGEGAKKLFDHDPVESSLSLHNLKLEENKPSEKTSRQNTTRGSISNTNKEL